ncbi:MAG: hypothetical protein ACLSX2_05530, partial [Christensenellaceae bacterium]
MADILQKAPVGIKRAGIVQGCAYGLRLQKIIKPNAAAGQQAQKSQDPAEKADVYRPIPFPALCTEAKPLR